MFRRLRNIVCCCLMALMLAECAYSHGQAEQGRAEAVPDAKAPAAIRVPFRLLPNKMIAVQAELAGRAALAVNALPLLQKIADMVEELL